MEKANREEVVENGVVSETNKERGMIDKAMPDQFANVLPIFSNKAVENNRVFDWRMKKIKHSYREWNLNFEKIKSPRMMYMSFAT